LYVPMNAASELVIAAVVVSAMVAAASLDQSIKQLPARRRIGVLAYSAYSLAADAHYGLRWYVPLAAVWLPVTVAAAVVGWSDHPGEARALALAAMVVGLVAHIVVTALVAAPTLLSQREVAGDERALARVFDRFERSHSVRALIDLATLAASLWALVATVTGG
jgi:hypothetical protein